MPTVLRFNRSVIGAKWDWLEKFFGQAPDKAIAALNQDIGIPSGLASLGVTEAMMEQVAQEALKDHCHATNPRLATAADYLALMRDSA